MKNTFLGRRLIALQQALNNRRFPYILDLFSALFHSLNKKKRPAIKRVENKKKLSSAWKDDRARLFIVKPRSQNK